MSQNLVELNSATMKRAVTALLFVEDPGAALFMQSLPQILGSTGIGIRIIALKYARRYFSPDDLEPDMYDKASLEELLLDFKPDILIAGTSENPDSLVFPLIQAARRAGVVIVGAVDAIANARDRFRGRETSPMHYMADWLLVPDEATKQAYKDLGVAASHIAVCGHPRMHEIADIREHWDEADRKMHRERWLGISDPRKKVILFASELSVGLNTALFQRSSHYTLVGNPENISRTEIVLDELFTAVAKLDFVPFMVLRLHPKQALQDAATHADCFDFISHTEPMLEMIHAADLVVGMTSILLVEAAALGRPVLSIVPILAEREWLGELGQDISCVSTPEEIVDYLELGARETGWPEARLPRQSTDASATIIHLIEMALEDSRP